jgi:hypothetical protein
VFEAAQGKVEAMAFRGAPLVEIEVFIETIPKLDADERSALWLLAWVEREQCARGQLERERIPSLSA